MHARVIIPSCTAHQLPPLSTAVSLPQVYKEYEERAKRFLGLRGSLAIGAEDVNALAAKLQQQSRTRAALQAVAASMAAENAGLQAKLAGGSDGGASGSASACQGTAHYMLLLCLASQATLLVDP